MESNLSSAHTSKVDTTSTHMSKADTTSARVSKVDTRSARTSKADTKSARVSKADTTSARVSKTEPRSARVSKADTRSARTSKADTKSARGSKADTTSARTPKADTTSARTSKEDTTSARNSKIETAQFPSKIEITPARMSKDDTVAVQTFKPNPRLSQMLASNTALENRLGENRPETLIFADTDFSDTNIVLRPPYRQRRTTIIAELPDINITPVDIQKMIEGGMNVAKLVATYCTVGDRVKMLAKVDKAAKTCCQKFGVSEWPVASCITLRTCIMRTGILEDDVEEIYIKEGSTVIISTDLANYNKCRENLIYVSNSYLTKDVRVGMEASIAEGEVVMEIVEMVDANSIKCLVIKSGKLTSMEIFSVRGMKHSRPYVTSKDLEIIQFCLQYQVDMIIIHYVRHCETLRAAKHFMGTKVKRPQLICGVCTETGLDNVDEILKESDGLMLGREFMQYEMSPGYRYRLPQVQKWMSAKCQQARKPFFLSGGIFDDFIKKGIRNKNEIYDVTNALMDGVTGFVLQKCHNVDRTIDAIRAISDLCCTVEPLTFNVSDIRRLGDEFKLPVNAAEAAVISCAFVAIQTKAKLIVLPTVSGRTAKALIHLRPNCLVITVSTDIRVTKLLSMCRCVIPLLYKGVAGKKWQHTIDLRVLYALEYAVLRNWVEIGDIYIILERATDSSSFCDKTRICKVDFTRRHLVECPDEDDDDIKEPIASGQEGKKENQNEEHKHKRQSTVKIDEKISAHQIKEKTEDTH